MRIQCVQSIFYAGRIDANFKTIRAFFKKAVLEKCDLLVFPAYALMGFNPQDRLKSREDLALCSKYLQKLLKLSAENPNTALVLDLPVINANLLYHRMVFISEGKVLAYHDKSVLNKSASIVEAEYFEAGKLSPPLFYKGKKIALRFAEGLLASDTLTQGVDLIVCVDAYPYSYQTLLSRKQSLIFAAVHNKSNLLYLNQAGGCESYILQGGSFYYTYAEKKIEQLPLFVSEVMNIDSFYSNEQWIEMSNQIDKMPLIAQIHDALVVGIRDYFKKNGVKSAVLGLSGGIDSAVVLPLAVEALGRKNVFALMMPSQFSSQHSVDDAVKLADNLQIYYEIVPIAPIFDKFNTQLQPLFRDLPFNLTEENLQARIRGSLLMAVSNKFGHLLLNTSNKTESACGYGTLYGDLCGAISVIGDLYKWQVYELAKYINRKKVIIPLNSIEKPPSAELRPNQKDSDSLPEYDVLDAILKGHLEEGLSNHALIKRGFAPSSVERVLTLLSNSEFKRKQLPPPLRVSNFCFNIDRKFR